MCHYWKWTLLLTAESSMLSQLSQVTETQQTQLPKASSLLIDTHKPTMPRCHAQELSIPHLRSIINKWPSQTGRIVRSPHHTLYPYSFLMSPTPFGPLYVLWQKANHIMAISIHQKKKITPWNIRKKESSISASPMRFFLASLQTWMAPHGDQR